MAKLIRIVAVSAVLFAHATKGAASRNDSHKHRYGCSHDEVVEPYHTEILDQLSAVPRQAHVSLNSNIELNWKPGQTEMLEKEAQQNRFDGLTAQSSKGPQPIRITIDYQLEQETPLPAKKHLKDKLVPRMIASLQRIIRVKNPVAGKLKLPRQCAQHSGDWTCEKAAPVSNCGRVARHKREYFGDFVECSGGNEGCKYLRGGKGLKNTDFLLYVTTKRTSHCSRGLLAFAGYCVLDPTSNRPLAGFANFCPNALEDEPEAFQAQLETAIHEALHALAFSTTLFSHYISKEGQLLGRHNVVGSFEGSSGGRVHKIITPTVVREARRHFSCPTLDGAELENEGGPGIAGSHWESRVFQYEIMDGQAGNNMDFERHVVTRLTLAALEDTGWYKANWAAANTLQLGRNAGCEFVNQDCNNPSPAHQDFYCTGKRDKCVWDRTAQGTCDQDYFLMDGCSYTRPYMNTVCTDPSHLPPSAKIWGQGYGTQARCMEHDTSHNFVRRSVGILTPPPLGCYEMECDREGTTVFLKMFEQYIKCPAGKNVELRDIPGIDFLSGSIGPCPRAEEICPALTCPASCTVHGRCVDGKCECHLGFAGNDCSEEICMADSCEEDEFCSAWTGLCTRRLNGNGTGSPRADLDQKAAKDDHLLSEEIGNDTGKVQMANGEWAHIVDLETLPGGSFDMLIGTEKHMAEQKAEAEEVRERRSSNMSLDKFARPVASVIGALCALLLVVLSLMMRLRVKPNNRPAEEGVLPNSKTSEDKDVESSGKAGFNSRKDQLAKEMAEMSLRSTAVSDRSALEDSVIHAGAFVDDCLDGMHDLSFSGESFYSIVSEQDDIHDPQAQEGGDIADMSTQLSMSQRSISGSIPSGSSSPRTPCSTRPAKPSRLKPQDGIIFLQ